jgi:hypothetical protein
LTFTSTSKSHLFFRRPLLPFSIPKNQKGIQGLPSLRFFSLRRFTSTRQPHNSQDYHLPGLRCLLSVSHTLKALIRLAPSDPISCRIHPWGLPFRDDIHLQSCSLSPRPLPSCSYRENSYCRIFGVLLAPRIHAN